jgi:TolA-binding protein
VGLAAYNAGRYQPALDLLNLLTAGNPAAAHRGDALYLAGACQEKLGNAAQAEPLYRQALEGKDPQYAGLAGAALVNLYANQGNLEAARKMAADLQKTEASSAAKAYALNALGQALYDAQQYAEAEQTYARVLTGLPDTAAAPYALLGSAWAKLALKDPTAGDTFWSVAQQYPASPAAQKVPDGLLAVAEKLFSDGKYAEAQAAYQRLVEAFPQSELAPAAQYKLGWALLKQNQPEAALPHFVAAAPKATAPAVAADARYQAARLLLAAQPAQAAALLEPFRDQYQDTTVAPAALVLWGRALTDEKQYEAAAAAFQLVLARYPKDPAAAEAGLGLARLYRLQKKMDQARATLTQTLTTATGAVGAEAQFELASVYRDQGDTKRAAEEFLKVAILYGDPAWSAQAQYQAGQCYEALGDKPSATAAYKLVGRDYAQQQPWADQCAARLKALGTG